jgi:hypothetical protein
MLYVIDNIHLIEEDAGVNDVECRVIQDTGENHVFEEL